MPLYGDEKRRYQANWLKQRRDTWFKDNGPCAKCGTWDNLELHHRDPVVKITHRIWSWSRDRREKELAKCAVLCVNCHNSMHATEHGTRRSYEAHGCRCVACRAANAAHLRSKRLKRKQLMSPSSKG